MSGSKSFLFFSASWSSSIIWQTVFWDFSYPTLANCLIRVFRGLHIIQKLCTSALPDAHSGGITPNEKGSIEAIHDIISYRTV